MLSSGRGQACPVSSRLLICFLGSWHCLRENLLARQWRLVGRHGFLSCIHWLSGQGLHPSYGGFCRCSRLVCGAVGALGRSRGVSRQGMFEALLPEAGVAPGLLGSILAGVGQNKQNARVLLGWGKRLWSSM